MATIEADRVGKTDTEIQAARIAATPALAEAIGRVIKDAQALLARLSAEPGCGIGIDPTFWSMSDAQAAMRRYQNNTQS